MPQRKQIEWYQQWKMFKDEETFLFKEWMFPNTLEDFKDKEVLECGCGRGQHTRIVANAAPKKITAVDLNTAEIAKELNKDCDNIEFIEGDIATINLHKEFDVVFSIGVIHHTDNPDKTFENMKTHTKKEGKLFIWVYSKEGNFFVRKIVEPIRKFFLTRISRNSVLSISKWLTFLLYIPVYSIYRLPFKFLPYYEYFDNFRKLSFYRNMLNVFDKLNAPQVIFIDKKRIEKWFDNNEFKNISIARYKGVSWRGSGVKI